MMGARQKLKGGIEYDVICYRRYYKYVKHHSHAVKKSLARRRRRVANSIYYGTIKGEVNDE